MPSGTAAEPVGPGQIRIDRGSYVANVDVPFPASIVATPSVIKQGLEDKGFSNVRVSESAPSNWPLSSDGDYFVTASWQNSAKVFDLPDAVTEHRKVA